MSNPSNVTPPQLWLASQSPRRQSLLDSVGLPFQVQVSHAEEVDSFGGSVEKTVLENAMRKAAIVTRQVPNDSDVVIAADTLVAIGDRIISKPTDRNEALANLRAYSGRSHRVLTGLVLQSRQYGLRQQAVVTQVSFRPLAEDEMQAYVETPEPYDKAGGYGIQGLACLFVDKVEGSYSNVMGLPIEALLKELTALTGMAPARWLRK